MLSPKLLPLFSNLEVAGNQKYTGILRGTNFIFYFLDLALFGEYCGEYLGKYMGRIFGANIRGE